MDRYSEKFWDYNRQTKSAADPIGSDPIGSARASAEADSGGLKKSPPRLPESASDPIDGLFP